MATSGSNKLIAFADRRRLAVAKKQGQFHINMDMEGNCKGDIKNTNVKQVVHIKYQELHSNRKVAKMKKEIKSNKEKSMLKEESNYLKLSEC